MGAYGRVDEGAPFSTSFSPLWLKPHGRSRLVGSLFVSHNTYIGKGEPSFSPRAPECQHGISRPMRFSSARAVSTDGPLSHFFDGGTQEDEHIQRINDGADGAYVRQIYKQVIMDGDAAPK